jgi:hypothetical protein
MHACWAGLCLACLRAPPCALHAHVNIMHAYAVHARAVYSAFYVGINIDMVTADIVGKSIFRAKSIIRVGVLRKF